MIRKDIYFRHLSADSESRPYWEWEIKGKTPSQEDSTDIGSSGVNSYLDTDGSFTNGSQHTEHFEYTENGMKIIPVKRTTTTEKHYDSDGNLLSEKVTIVEEEQFDKKVYV